MSNVAARAVAFAGALLLFVVLWVLAWGLLAYGACANEGGSLSGRGFSCLLPDGHQIPWFAFHPLPALILCMVAAGAIPYLLYRWFMRSKWYGA